MNPFANKAIYLSGPMEGLENYNREAFCAIEVELVTLGAAYVFNPARHYDGFGDVDWPRGEYMRRDLHELTSGGHSVKPWGEYELVVALNGHENSAGACLELAVASQCGIPILYESDVSQAFTAAIGIANG